MIRTIIYSVIRVWFCLTGEFKFAKRYRVLRASRNYRIRIAFRETRVVLRPSPGAFRETDNNNARRGVLRCQCTRTITRLLRYSRLRGTEYENYAAIFVRLLLLLFVRLFSRETRGRFYVSVPTTLKHLPERRETAITLPWWLLYGVRSV